MSNLKSGLRLVAASLTLLASARAFAQDAEHQHVDWCSEDGLYDDVKPVDMAPATLKVGFFGKNIAMLAAQAKGFFAAENLSVTYLQIASSEQAFKDLRDGNYDIILSSVDNVVNYRLNPNNALGAIQPVQAFMSVDYANNLTAAGKLGINTVEDLRGKKVAVDAPASGFAYILYEILAKHGLQRNVDYQTVLIGGGAARFNALMAGTVDGTLLNNGFEIRAAAGGRKLFETAYDITYPYLGSVGVAERPWMKAHSDVLIRFIRAYVAASAWSFDPANRAEAIKQLQTQPNTSAALAAKLLDAQLTFGRGLVRDAYIGDFEREGLSNVLQLRQKYDGFENPENLTKLATPAGGIYDLHWYHQAIGDSDTGD
jgi:ABC-type nitrate/sulfonate/bicarbonate transport system substrate-binding protein